MQRSCFGQYYGSRSNVWLSERKRRRPHRAPACNDLSVEVQCSSSESSPPGEQPPGRHEFPGGGGGQGGGRRNDRKIESVDRNDTRAPPRRRSPRPETRRNHARRSIYRTRGCPKPDTASKQSSFSWRNPRHWESEKLLETSCKLGQNQFYRSKDQLLGSPPHVQARATCSSVYGWLQMYNVSFKDLYTLLSICSAG